MKSIIKPFLLLAPLAMITACESTFFSSTSVDNLCFTDDGNSQPCSSDFSSPTSQSISATGTDSSLFKTNTNFQLLNEYIEQMAMELSKDLNGANIVYPIAVSSFVHLDSTLKNTNTLGNQIAEYFIGELQEMGLPVNDNKVMGSIQVTPLGDFAFSRNFEELKKQQNIGYVLAGTMLRNDKGVVINARIIGTTSNRVIASTTKLIPNIILAQI